MANKRGISGPGRLSTGGDHATKHLGGGRDVGEGFSRVGRLSVASAGKKGSAEPVPGVGVPRGERVQHCCMHVTCQSFSLIRAMRSVFVKCNSTLR